MLRRLYAAAAADATRRSTAVAGRSKLAPAAARSIMRHDGTEAQRRWHQLEDPAIPCQSGDYLQCLSGAS